MTDTLRVGRIRLGVILFAALAAISALTLGSAMASGSAPSTPQLPCRDGGEHCSHIGYSDAWLNGTTVQLEYSHAKFCHEPPDSAADSHCEAGTAGITAPPSGAVVSDLYVVVPIGFTPPDTTLQCPIAGHCIDHPHTIDLSQLFGATSANAILPAHSHVLEDAESFQSTWWPVVVVGVKNIDAWNTIVAAKNIDSVDACQTSGDCFPEAPTNTYLFFQVLGPGMSPQGPA